MSNIVSVPIDCTSKLNNFHLNVKEKLGASAKFILVAYIPAVPQFPLSLNWSDIPIDCFQGAVIQGEKINDLYITTPYGLGAGAPKPLLILSSDMSLWPSTIMVAQNTIFQPMALNADDNGIIFVRLAPQTELSRLFNLALPAANANLISTIPEPAPPVYTPCIYRIYVCISVAGVLSIKRTFSSVSVNEMLNGGVPLTAGASYMFDILVSGESINLTYSVTGGIINFLQVVSVPGGA